MAKQDNTKITYEESAAGLSMRIVVPPRDTDGGDRFMYLGSLALVLFGAVVVVQGGSSTLFGGMVFMTGVVGVILSFYNRNRVWRGSDTLYSVGTADGKVTFARGSYEQTFELAKLGRIWFTERTYSGQPSGVDLTAYYDGSERFIFDIIELNYVSDDAAEFLDRIDGYLNNTMDSEYTIQTGYRPDYATDTSVEARNPRELAPASQRLFFSSLTSLAMLVYFSEWSHWPVNLLIGIVGAPALFALSLSLCRSCTCRFRRPADFVSWPLLVAGAGWVLKVMIDFLATSEGLPGLSVITLPIIFLLMTIIINRVIGGCSCGANSH